jgi:hypothetical protein
VTNARRVGGVVIVAIGVVAGGCSATPPPSVGVQLPTSGASAVTAVATPADSASETAGSPQPPTPVASDAPLATLVIGAQRHPGKVGGFTFGRFSESAPWLPATALDTVPVRAGTELRVELDERATVKDWTARIATAADITADAVTGLASGVGPAAAFTAPGPGDWVVSVTITYGQGLGSGAYYWHLKVE